MRSIRATECYSALKRKESPAQGTAWMNVLDITLGETSRIQEDTYCVIPPVRGAYSSQMHRDESVVVSRGWGRGEGTWCGVGTEFLLQVIRKFCVRSGDGHTDTVNVFDGTELYT